MQAHRHAYVHVHVHAYANVNVDVNVTADGYYVSMCSWPSVSLRQCKPKEMSRIAEA